MVMKILLSNFIKVVWKNILVILIFVVLGGVVGGFYVYIKKYIMYIVSCFLMVVYCYNNSMVNE